MRWLGLKRKEQAHHMPRSDVIKPYTERCVVEDVLLRTFCLSLAQGFGGWCAGMVWVWVRGLTDARMHPGRTEGGGLRKGSRDPHTKGIGPPVPKVA